MPDREGESGKEAAMATVPGLPVVTGNGALLCPAGTVTLAGTDAICGLLLARVTVTPPFGAGPVNVTVPVALAPLTIDCGLSTSESRARGAVTVSGGTVWSVAPENEAEMAAVPGAMVVTAKVAVL